MPNCAILNEGSFLTSTPAKRIATARAGVSPRMERMVVAEIGALDLVVGADLRRRAGGDDAAIDENADAVGEREHGRHVVLDQHDGNLAAQFLQQLHHARGFGAVSY